jgi:uncharacterized membrane protein
LPRLRFGLVWASNDFWLSEMSERNEDPRGLQHAVHWTLLSGMVVSSILLISGMIAMLDQGHQEASPHESLATLLRDAGRLRGPALTTLGLLVLMVTPVLRVVVLLIGWARRRDWVFAAVAMMVLALLILSMSLGMG